MEADAELVRETLSRAAGALFKRTRPHKSDPAARKNPKWFLVCDSTRTEASCINVVWKDGEGNLWLESETVADVFDLVKGGKEEEAFRTLKNDCGNKVIRRTLGKRSPLIQQKLSVCHEIAEMFSFEGGRVRIIYDAKTASIRLGVKLVATTRPKSLICYVELAVRTLQEAYDSVLKSIRNTDCITSVSGQ